jgi:hypothetical protein
MDNKSQLDLIFKYYIQIVKINTILSDLITYSNKLHVSDSQCFGIMLEKYKELLITKLNLYSSLEFGALGEYLRSEGYSFDYELSFFYDKDYTYFYILYDNVCYVYNTYIDLYEHYVEFQSNYSKYSNILYKDLPEFIADCIKHAGNVPIRLRWADRYLKNYLSAEEVVLFIRAVCTAANALSKKTDATLIAGIPIDIIQV